MGLRALGLCTCNPSPAYNPTQLSLVASTTQCKLQKCSDPCDDWLQASAEPHPLFVGGGPYP